MENIDIKHLENVKGMILEGIKAELKNEILSKYSISDQLNASAEESVVIKNDIASILAKGHAKQDAVTATTTFEELELVIPRKV